jgi:ferric-dicitrate binding protein FerR (iron transport regulator)
MSEHDELTPSQQRRARELLEQSAQQLDSATAHRLANIRVAALRGESRTPERRHWRLPVAGAAVAMALVAAVALNVWHDADVPPQQIALDDMDLLLAQDEPELYLDADFYAWLDDENG